MSLQRYRTGEFLIDLNTREIRRGDHAIDIEAKVFDLIALLLEHRDRAVTKRELNVALWAERPVTDAALSQQLRKARRALGDDGDAQATIRTVHGRGLRWVAPVVVENIADDTAVVSAPPTTIKRKNNTLALAALAIVILFVCVAFVVRAVHPLDNASPQRRIAVLPLQNQTGDAALSWSSIGLMGLMTGLFDQQGGIEVVPAQIIQSSAAPNIDASNLKSLRTALGASHIVTTTLRKLGSVYELEVHLVAAGHAERTDTLHGTDPASLAADAVVRVRRWLDLVAVKQTNPVVSNPFLAEAYGRGLDAQLHGDAAAAKKYFSICLDQDPGLVWARLGLAAAQSQSGDSAAALENATKVVNAARERNDEDLLISGLRLLASLNFFRGDLADATAHVDEAMKHVSAKEHPLAFVDLLVAHASIDDERGDPAHARTQFEQAVKVARESGYVHGEASALVNLASVENGAGNIAAAAADLQTGLDAARRSGDAHLEMATLGDLGGVEANQGHLLSALTLFKRAITLARERGDTNLKVLITSRLLWTMAPFGHDAIAQQLGERLLSVADRQGNPYWQGEAHFALAGVAMHGGKWSAALDELERARSAYEQAGMTRDMPEILSLRIEAATQTGDGAQIRAAEQFFREQSQIPAAAPQWRSWSPLLSAQLKAAGGDIAGAATDLSRALDDANGSTGPVEEASLFQLGRWQMKTGHASDLLERPEWKPLLQQQPEAIALNVAALRAAGRNDEAQAEQLRLEALQRAPELDIDPAWLADF